MPEVEPVTSAVLFLSGVSCVQILSVHSKKSVAAILRGRNERRLQTGSQNGAG